MANHVSTNGLHNFYDLKKGKEKKSITFAPTFKAAATPYLCIGSRHFYRSHTTKSHTYYENNKHKKKHQKVCHKGSKRRNAKPLIIRGFKNTNHGQFATLQRGGDTL